MDEIDKLEGKELAEAVALAQGMTKAELSASGHAWHDVKGNMWIIANKEPGLFGLYRPDLDLLQAWELVEWITAKERRADFYLSREDDGRWSVIIHDLQWLHAVDNYYKVSVDVYNEPTAPIAICRAFLKAKAAE